MTGFRSTIFRTALAVVPLAVAAIVAVNSFTSAAPKPAAAAPAKPPIAFNPSHPHFLGHGSEVHGTVYTLVGKLNALSITHVTSGGGIPIFLPDISLYLMNTVTSVRSTQVKTDLDGAFAFPEQPQASYRLCWSAPGYAPGCTQTAFTLGGTTAYLPPTAIVPNAGVVFGRVTLKDGRPCRFLLPQFGRNTFTRLQAVTGKGPSPWVDANSAGYYVLPALPNGAVSIKASCEGLNTSQGGSVGAEPSVVDVVLPNANPRVNRVTASQGARMVRAAAAGSTVHFEAAVTSGGSHPLHYSWAVFPATAGFTSADSPKADLDVPKTRGQVLVFLLAHDDFGGNAFWRVPLSTTPDRIRFSGHVRGNDTASLAGATVSINGVIQQTTPGGDFNIVLPGEAPRYVVTIVKAGYQMLSRALYAPLTQANFELYRAQEFTIDPTKPITIVENPAETRGDKRDVKPAVGSVLLIPAKALAAGADGLGALAAGPVTVQIATYNRNDANDQLPGDYGGLVKSGKDGKDDKGVALKSFGAVDVAFRDANGKPVNLGPNAQATLRVAIDPAMMKNAPDKIAMWHYSVEKGMWTEDGVAIRKGGFYEAQVTHFSPVNMDLAFGPASCTLINVDTSIMPLPFRIRMTDISGPGVDPGHQNQWISDAVSAVFREIPGSTVRFDMVDSNGNIIPNASQTITVGLPTPQGAMWPAPPPAASGPAYDCTTTITYDLHTNFNGPNGSPHIFPPGPNAFLSYQTPAAYQNPVSADLLTVAYYHAIDPNGTKTQPLSNADFDNWKNLNGFGRPAGQAHTAYQNLYDLGFGRDMHMQTGGQFGTCPTCVAFYVSNYNDADAAAAASAGLIATVAMEYGPLDETGAIFTRFYVFNASGAILNAAVLDDFGAKNVPALCVICHNGDIASNATVSDIVNSGGNLQTSRFIPFDLDSFAYPADPTFQRPAKEADFKAMNTVILNQTNPSTAEVNLIRHWYGAENNPALPNVNFNGSIVVDDWSSNPNLYTDVIKPNCRACHTTRDSGGFDISWDSFTSLDNDAFSVKILACSLPTASTPMPQAERTFARFWLSTHPNAPIELGAAGLTGWGAVGCPP